MTTNLTRSSTKCRDCGNDLWDVYDNMAVCSNCAAERPYHRRQGNSGEMTQSQIKQLDFIKGWFKRYFRKESLATWDTKFQNETGLVYLTVETSDHPLTMDGAFIVIGRRGGIKVLHSRGLSNVHDEKFYAKFLGGKVGW